MTTRMGKPNSLIPLPRVVRGGLSLLKTLRSPPCVPVMQPAGPRQRDDLADLRQFGLSAVRRVLAQPEISPVGVVVVDVLADHATELPLIDGDHVIEAIPPKAADLELTQRP